MHQPRLQDLQPADLRQWYDHPVSRLLLEHLQRERSAALEDIAASTAGDRRHEATLTAGGLAFIDTLWGLLHPPEPEPQPAEEKFVDPASLKPVTT